MKTVRPTLRDAAMLLFRVRALSKDNSCCGITPIDLIVNSSYELLVFRSMCVKDRWERFFSANAFSVK